MTYGKAFDSSVIAEARKSRLLIKPEWIQSPRLTEPAISAAVQLLFSGSKSERPDALIIDDDNYVADATRALAATGLRTPDDLEVIAHCNYPEPPASALKTKGLGYDIVALINECVECIDAQRTGVQPVKERLVPAVFES